MPWAVDTVAPWLGYTRLNVGSRWPRGTAVLQGLAPALTLPGCPAGGGQEGLRGRTSWDGQQDPSGSEESGHLLTLAAAFVPCLSRKSQREAEAGSLGVSGGDRSPGSSKLEQGVWPAGEGPTRSQGLVLGPRPAAVTTKLWSVSPRTGSARDQAARRRRQDFCRD